MRDNYRSYLLFNKNRRASVITDKEIFQSLVDNKAIVMTLKNGEKIAIYLDNENCLEITQWYNEEIHSDWGEEYTEPSGWYNCFECSGYDVLAEYKIPDYGYLYVETVDKFETKVFF